MKAAFRRAVERCWRWALAEYLRPILTDAELDEWERRIFAARKRAEALTPFPRRSL